MMPCPILPEEELESYRALFWSVSMICGDLKRLWVCFSIWESFFSLMWTGARLVAIVFEAMNFMLPTVDFTFFLATN